MNYTEVNFTIVPYSEDVCDALIAELGNIGFDSFSETDSGFSAYIPSKEFKEESINELELMQFFSENFKITMKSAEIADQNWNKMWEDNFTTIVVDDRIQVRTKFHEAVPNIEHEIIIEPKMSFGTGHHATTVLMLRTILERGAEIKGKQVLDMGCGTGILAIMAAKVGAKQIIGIDIDEWAYNNAMENIENNHLSNITIKIGDASLLEKENNFDIVLANINRNILLNDMLHYIDKLNSNGWLIMSGFYLQDLPLIQEKAESLGLIFKAYHEEKQWVSASFYKK